MKNQLYIKSVDNNFFNRPNLELFIDTIFNNFIDLYNFPYLKHNKTEILKLLSSNNFYGFLVFHGNIIIGYLLGEVINLNNQFVFFINYLFIAPTFRNNKLGTQLINIAKQYVIMNDFDAIAQLCDINNQNIINFYEKLGFIISNEKLHQNHELFIWKK
jgi:ribosomal protein S18 acetylase RimI-like enzyme